MYAARRRGAKDLSTVLISLIDAPPLAFSGKPLQQTRSWTDTAVSNCLGVLRGSTVATLQRRDILLTTDKSTTGVLARMMASSSSITRQRIRQEEEDLPSHSGGGAQGTAEGPQEQDYSPPGVFTTITAMGAGAGGAVLVAAIGVWAVFQMAFWVAGEAGRSIKTTDASPSVGERDPPTETA